MVRAAKPSRQRRGADNKSARCLLKKIAREQKNTRERNNLALFQSPKRQSEYQGGYRAVISDRSGTALPILLGAVIIAAAILLSTLITPWARGSSGWTVRTMTICGWSTG
jgi:hypothetical protein